MIGLRLRLRLLLMLLRLLQSDPVSPSLHGQNAGIENSTKVNTAILPTHLLHVL